MKTILITSILLAVGCAQAQAVGAVSASNDERESMRIIQTVPLSFPQSALDRGITSGEARVAISLDHTGALTDVLVVSYSQAAFAEAAERAIREWRYVPMRVLDEHVATQAVLVFTFEGRGVVVNIDATSDLTAHVLSFVRSRQYGPCPLSRLDRIPTPVQFVEPAYGSWFVDHGVKGRAVVEFFIDENGSVRVPAVISSDFWELGVLAMEAVRQWRFEPPTSRGRRVLVHVRQEFVFGRGATG